MSKIIKLTPELIQESVRDFADVLKNAKLSGGKIDFSKTFTYEKRVSTIYFTAEAWVKMIMLIQEFDKEVAWHGVAHRVDNEDLDEYIVSDILVYPQEVTGATVNTDQDKYQTWLMNHEDDVFNNIRMQGHSHVNMAPSPSGVDLTHQEKILDQLENDMFYIFMIWNKSFKRNIKIYDLQKNVLFEDGDVEVKILDSGVGLQEFIDSAKELVVAKTYTQTSTYNKNTTTTAATVTAIAQGVTNKPVDTKDKPKTKINDSYYDYYGIDDTEYDPDGMYGEWWRG